MKSLGFCRASQVSRRVKRGVQTSKRRGYGIVQHVVSGTAPLFRRRLPQEDRRRFNHTACFLHNFRIFSFLPPTSSTLPRRSPRTSHLSYRLGNRSPQPDRRGARLGKRTATNPESLARRSRPRRTTRTVSPVNSRRSGCSRSLGIFLNIFIKKTKFFCGLCMLSLRSLLVYTGGKL